jgi:hypothetical protein
MPFSPLVLSPLIATTRRPTVATSATIDTILFVSFMGFVIMKMSAEVCGEGIPGRASI